MTRTVLSNTTADPDMEPARVTLMRARVRA
jgi:hypothetical protein